MEATLASAWEENCADGKSVELAVVGRADPGVVGNEESDCTFLLCRFGVRCSGRRVTIGVEGALLFS